MFPIIIIEQSLEDKRKVVEILVTCMHAVGYNWWEVVIVPDGRPSSPIQAAMRYPFADGMEGEMRWRSAKEKSPTTLLKSMPFIPCAGTTVGDIASLVDKEQMKYHIGPNDDRSGRSWVFELIQKLIDTKKIEGDSLELWELMRYRYLAEESGCTRWAIGELNPGLYLKRPVDPPAKMFAHRYVKTGLGQWEGKNGLYMVAENGKVVFRELRDWAVDRTDSNYLITTYDKMIYCTDMYDEFMLV